MSYRNLVLVLLFTALTLACLAAPEKTGRFTITFKERSPYSREKTFRYPIRTGKGQEYDLTKESFSVYIPHKYNPAKPPGLFVWISTGPYGDPLPGWFSVFEKMNLIFIMPNNAGNDRQPSWQRIGLALDAEHNIRKRYKVDPRRVYVGGPSAGGNRALISALYHPDLFTGCFMMVSPTSFRNTQFGTVNIPASFPPPPAKWFDRARKTQRFVMLAGEKDKWAKPAIVKAVAENNYTDFTYPAAYLLVPGLAHNVPDASWVEKGLKILDKPLKKK